MKQSEKSDPYYTTQYEQFYCNSIEQMYIIVFKLTQLRQAVSDIKQSIYTLKTITAYNLKTDTSLQRRPDLSGKAISDNISLQGQSVVSSSILQKVPQKQVQQQDPLYDCTCVVYQYMSMLIGLLLQQIGIARCHVQVKFPQNSTQMMRLKIQTLANDDIWSEIVTIIQLLTYQYKEKITEIHNVIKNIDLVTNIDDCLDNLLKLEKSILQIDYAGILEFIMVLIDGTRFNQEQFKQLIDKSNYKLKESFYDLNQQDNSMDQLLQCDLAQQTERLSNINKLNLKSLSQLYIKEDIYNIFELQHEFTPLCDLPSIDVQVLQIPGLNRFRLEKFINTPETTNIHKWVDKYNKCSSKDLPIYERINQYILQLKQLKAMQYHYKEQSNAEQLEHKSQIQEIISLRRANSPHSSLDQNPRITLNKAREELVLCSKMEPRLITPIQDNNQINIQLRVPDQVQSNNTNNLNVLDQGFSLDDLQYSFWHYSIWLTNFKSLIHLYQQINTENQNNQYYNDQYMVQNDQKTQQQRDWFNFIQQPNLWIVQQQLGNDMIYLIQNIIKSPVQCLIDIVYLETQTVLDENDIDPSLNNKVILERYQVVYMQQQFKQEYITKFIGQMLYSSYDLVMQTNTLTSIIQYMILYIEMMESPDLEL